MAHHALFLHEEILLLALHDKKGTIEIGSPYAYAVGGALLAELLVRERIELVPSRRKTFVQLLAAGSVGDPLLDDCLQRIANARRRATIQTWVVRFAGLRGLRERLAERLRRRGILRAEDKDIVVFFKRRTYPAVDPGPEREIVDRLRGAIFTDADVDGRTIVLLSLANGTKLLPMVFDRKELKARRDRIKALVSQEALGKAVKSAVEAAAAATMVILTG